MIIAKAGCVSPLGLWGEHARCRFPLPAAPPSWGHGGWARPRCGGGVGRGWGAGRTWPRRSQPRGHVASTCTCEIGFLGEPGPEKHRLGTDPEAKALPLPGHALLSGATPRPWVPGPSRKTSPLGVTGLGAQHAGVSGCGFESHPKNTNWATSLPSSQAVPTWVSLPVPRPGRTSPQL